MFRILIVDEDELMAKTLQDILYNHEYEYDLSIDAVATAGAARRFVKNASPPIDLILSDLKLQGSDIDGIELLRQLKNQFPQVQTIIYTGYPDSTLYMRIEEARIDDYLPKPFAANDLSARVHRLLRSRMTYDENIWLRRLADTSIAAEDFDDIEALAQAVTKDAQMLGFQRVRFYRLLDLDTADPAVIGVAQSGLDISDFTGAKTSISNSEYVKETWKKNKISYFEPDDPRVDFLKNGDLIPDFERPMGEWVGIPVESQGQCVAVLIMDNGDTPGRISTVQRKHLSLFAAQINTAYGRVLRQTAKQIREHIEKIASQLKEQLQHNAGFDSLRAFCVTFYVAVLKETPGANLSVIIQHDDEWLCEWIHYEQGKLAYQNKWRSTRESTVIPFLLSKHRQSLFLPEGTAKFREDHALTLHGREAKSWMAALFTSGDQTGALVVEHDERANAFSHDDFERLCALSDDLGGRIFSTWLDHQRRQLTERLALVQRASEDIMLLAAQSEDWLWHATLTLTTAHYGFNYDRALLLLKRPESEESTLTLVGRMAIGHNRWAKAKKDWERIAAEQQEIERIWREEERENNGSLALKYWNIYLDQLQGDMGELDRSPLEKKLKATPLELHLAIDDDRNALVEVMARNHPVRIPDEEREERIPPQIYDFLYGGGADSEYKETTCVVVPVTAGQETLGVLLIDNVWRRAPQQIEAVEYINTLANQAAMLYQNRQAAASRSQLDDFKYELLNGVGNRTQGETLTILARKVKRWLGADHVGIYPLSRSGDDFQYTEWQDAGYTGPLSGRRTSDARVPPLDAMILKSREIRVIDSVRDLKLHPYAKRVDVKSMIVAPVIETTSGEVRAVLYVDYKTERKFSAKMIETAREFAVLAATALRYHRELSQRDREQERLRKAGESLARMVERSTGAELTELTDIVTVVLEETAEAIDRSDVTLSLVLRDWERDAPNDPVKPVRREYEYNRATRTVKERRVNEIGVGIRGYVLETGEREYVPNLNNIDHVELRSRHFPVHADTREALYLPVSIGDDAKPIGVLVIESPKTYSFTDIAVEAWSGIATASALLFTQLRRQLWLQEILGVAGQITAPTDLKKTLEAIGQAIQRTTPDVDIVTIWYPKPGSPDTFVCGLATGPIDEKAKEEERSLNELPHIVRALEKTEPIYASVKDPKQDSFAERNQLRAYSSQPVKINEQSTGVLFLNYMHDHRFSSDERTIFPILASIIGATINDALLIEKTKAERRRFECALEIAQATGMTSEIDDIITQIFDMLKDKTYFPGATPAVLLYDENRQVLEFRSASFDSDRYKEMSISLDSDFVAAAAAKEAIEKEKKTPWRRGDIRTCPRPYHPLCKKTLSHLSVPLYNVETKKLIGVFVLESEQPHAFNKDAQQLAELIATDIRISVERAMMRKELEFNRTVAGTAAWATEAAHDINSETFNILSNTDEILDESGANHKLTEKQKEAVRRIEESIQRLAKVVLPIHQQAPEIIDLSDHLQRWVSKLLQGTKIPVHLTIESDPDQISIETYPLALKRVIGHLVRNSKAAFRNEKIQNPTIRVNIVQTTPEHIELIYEDSGPGIPHKLRAKILKEPINDPARPNRGMGLLLARFLTEQMEGSIHFDSSFSNGARFVITLPTAAINTAHDFKMH